MICFILPYLMNEIFIDFYDFDKKLIINGIDFKISKTNIKHYKIL